MGVRGVCAGALAALAMLLPATASAAPCTITWNGSTGGDWREEARWIPVGLPDADDVVCIAGGSVVLVEEDQVVGSLQVTGGTLLVAGAGLFLSSAANGSELGDPQAIDPAVTVGTDGTLRVGSAGALAGTLAVDGGTVQVDAGAGLDVAELLDLRGGTVTGAGGAEVGPGGILMSGAPDATAVVDVATLTTDLLVAESGTLEVGSAWNGLVGGALVGSLSVSSGAHIVLPTPVSQVGFTALVDVDGGTIETGTAGTSAFAGAVTVEGGLTVYSGVLSAGALTVQGGGLLSLVGTGSLVAGAVAIGQDGLVRGDQTGTPSLVAAGPVVVRTGGRLEGSVRVTPGVLLQGGTWAPYGSGPPVPLGGSAVLDGIYEIGIDLNGGTTDRAAVGGTVQLGGLSFVRTTDGFPALDTEWVPLTYGSATGAVGAVSGALLRDPNDPDPTAPARALLPIVEPTALRIRVVPAAAPVADVTTVTVGADRRLTATTSVHPGGLSTRLTLEYGPTAAYGSQAVLAPVAPGVTTVPASGQTGALAPGTYHVRLVLANDLGTIASGDIVVEVPADPVPPPAPPAPPAPPPTLPTPTVPEPVLPVTPTALTPVVAAGARTLAVTALRFGALRVPFSYRLTAACAAPCRARVELRVRSGKQRFDARLPGDGKVLATRRNVVLKRGVNALRINVSKAALRGVTWTPAGRFRTLRARLRVVLPQVDGRELVTVRDVTLRAPRP